MEIFKLSAAALTGCIFALLLKEYKPVFSAAIGIISALFLFFCVFGKIEYIFSTINAISSNLSFGSKYTQSLIKITGISYITRIGTDICRDSGQTAIGNSLEAVGKILIVTVSIPILLDVLNLLVGLL